MQGISDIKIIGIDDKRPPIIRKEPYIDLYFKLSHKAPADWCRDFNNLLADHAFKPNIQEKEGLYIEAWVRTPDEIIGFFEQLKESITTCTQQYINRIEHSASSARNGGSSLAEDQGEQGRLNRILASLDFGDTT